MSSTFTLTLGGRAYAVTVDGDTVLVDGKPFDVRMDGDRVLVDNVAYEVQIEDDRAIVGGIAHSLKIEGLGEQKKAAGKESARQMTAHEGAVTAIMPGKIIRLLVEIGEQVSEGDVICILEAMKMENELRAPKAGTIEALYVEPGQDVEMGSVLAEIK
jgi:acetyl-CoA/propionyl-CoA carboxylase biotin carboxyl carrier protein